MNQLVVNGVKKPYDCRKVRSNNEMREIERITKALNFNVL